MARVDDERPLIVLPLGESKLAEVWLQEVVRLGEWLLLVLMNTSEVSDRMDEDTGTERVTDQQWQQRQQWQQWIGLSWIRLDWEFDLISSLVYLTPFSSSLLSLSLSARIFWFDLLSFPVTFSFPLALDAFAHRGILTSVVPRPPFRDKLK